MVPPPSRHAADSSRDAAGRAAARVSRRAAAWCPGRVEQRKWIVVGVLGRQPGPSRRSCSGGDDKKNRRQSTPRRAVPGVEPVIVEELELIDEVVLVVDEVVLLFLVERDHRRRRAEEDAHGHGSRPRLHGRHCSPRTTPARRTVVSRTPIQQVPPKRDVGSASSNGVASFREEALAYGSSADAQKVLDLIKAEAACPGPTIAGGGPIAFSPPKDVSSSVTTPVEAAFEIDFSRRPETRGQFFVIKDTGRHRDVHLPYSEGDRTSVRCPWPSTSSTRALKKIVSCLRRDRRQPLAGSERRAPRRARGSCASRTRSPR